MLFLYKIEEHLKLQYEYKLDEFALRGVLGKSRKMLLNKIVVFKSEATVKLLSAGAENVPGCTACSVGSARDVPFMDELVL